MTRVVAYRCPKCGQSAGSRAQRPPVCWNPESPYCARRGVVMERKEEA